MRISISTLVTPPRKSGVGNYVVNLLKSLQYIDHENEYYVFIGKDTKHLFALNAPNFHPVYLPLSHDPRWLMRPLYYLWQNSLVYFSLKKYQVDLFHVPNLSLLWMCFVPTVVTIPDLAHFTITKYPRLRQVYRQLVPRITAKKAARIITISDSAQRDIVRFANVPKERVDVTYLAASIKKVTSECQDRVLNSYSVSKSSYLLYVGNALPHKNVERLLKAFSIVVRQAQVPLKLVLAGLKKCSLAKYADLILSLGIDDLVVTTGYISERDLSILYQNAFVFVFPSLYEGFGLPVLEAMTCGTPVVTSNTSSLPEVAGDAALLVDPLNISMIADTILLLFRDEALREALIHRGKTQAAKFSWDECAKQTLKTYQKVLG
jgi:glycosyltransferase involved in cell wall biosynthesis